MVAQYFGALFSRMKLRLVYIFYLLNFMYYYNLLLSRSSRDVSGPCLDCFEALEAYLETVVCFMMRVVRGAVS
jgi:hypothetical protein